tara:strand:+ start:215 stop:640 length:426 start_codon:yes stop_codon:yes gene_type:complete
MRRIIICDIDGTVAEVIDKEKIGVVQSKCIEDVANIIRNLKDSETEIYFITAREERYKKFTEDWFKLNDIPFDKLFMRKNGDMRSDEIIKMKIIEERIDYKKVWFVLEDNNNIIQMYLDRFRLTCLKVFNNIKKGDSNESI